MMSMRTTRVAAAGVVVLTLGIGFLSGVAWRSSSALEAERNASPSEEAPDSSERRRGLIVERVGLSAEQKIQVDSVVSDARTQLHQLRRDYREGYGNLLGSARASIKAVLTPEQAAEYDELLEEFDRRRAEEERMENERGRAGARNREERQGAKRESAGTGPERGRGDENPGRVSKSAVWQGDDPCTFGF